MLVFVISGVYGHMYRGKKEVFVFVNVIAFVRSQRCTGKR